jgi:antitoxin (DNA-binding transcriptional repressor) of toxin-antitoxin stability system
VIRTTLEDASTRLDELVAAALRGEDVLIATPGARGERVVRIVASPAEAVEPNQPRFGSAKGLIQMHDDFDDPLPDFDEYQ